MSKFRLYLMSVLLFFCGCSDKDSVYEPQIYTQQTMQNTPMSYKINNPYFFVNHTKVMELNGNKYKIPRESTGEVINDQNLLNFLINLNLVSSSCNVGDVIWVENNLYNKLNSISKHTNNEAQFINLLTYNRDKIGCASVEVAEKEIYNANNDEYIQKANSDSSQSYSRQIKPKVVLNEIGTDPQFGADLAGYNGKERQTAARQKFMNAANYANDQAYNNARVQDINAEIARQQNNFSNAINASNQCINNGIANSCIAFGDYLISQNQPKVAKEFYGMACDNRSQQGCDKFRMLQEKGW